VILHSHISSHISHVTNRQNRLFVSPPGGDRGAESDEYSCRDLLVRGDLSNKVIFLEGQLGKKKRA
jgi:hypothetical protein